MSNVPWDAWLHLVELLLVVFIVPGLKKLIGVLISLQGSLSLLSQTVNQHTQSFALHVQEDRQHFEKIDTHVGEVQGNIREMFGMMHLERRGGLERRGET